MKYTKTGLPYIEFKDINHNECSIQKSSVATEDCIWLGVDIANPEIRKSKSTRMHLSIKHVKMLLPILQLFVDTGEINMKEERQRNRLLNAFQLVKNGKKIPHLKFEEFEKLMDIEHDHNGCIKKGN